MTNLKKCKDCGKEISKSADRCPHCGAKPPGCGSFICLLIVALAISIFFITSCSRSDAPPATSIKMSNDSKRFKATEQNFSVVVDDKTKTIALENKTGKPLKDIEISLRKDVVAFELYGLKFKELPEKITQINFTDLKKDTGTLQTGTNFNGTPFDGTLSDIKFFTGYSPSTKGISIPIKN